MNSGSIHVVFGDSARLTLLSSQEMAPHLDSVISLNDDLRVGPIVNLSQSNSIIDRQSWLTQNNPCLIEREYFCSNVSMDIQKIQNLRAKLKKDKKIYIWCGRRTLDLLGTARLIFELENHFESLVITDIPEIKIRSKFGHDYIPECLGVMNPEEVHLIEKYFRSLNEQDCKSWVKLWTRLMSENKALRISSTDSLIESVEESYFDTTLLSNCTNQFLNSARVIGKTLFDIQFEASDSTLNWRLVHLAKSKRLNFTDKLNCMREYMVKTLDTKT